VRIRQVALQNGVKLPDYEFEQQLHNTGHKLIAGIDEVGRGPWAGPVTAAAVILDPKHIPSGLDDSKKLSPAKRQHLAKQITETSQWAIVHVDVDEIDQINILQASLSAMRRAIEQLPGLPDHVLIDGNRAPENLKCDATTIVKGDARSLSIAAASIIAKVARDALMADLAVQFPHYGWETNAGYGTKRHQEGLKSHGVSPHHRRSFKPIHKMLCQANLITH
jgi:ribonuclease HII